MPDAHGSPSDSWRGRLSPRQLALALACIALPIVGIQLSLYDRSVVPMDEGHLAASAAWMLRGKLLYRDIHTGIFPAIYYLAALLFRTTTHDLIVLRIAAVVVNTTTALTLFFIARRSVRLHWAVLPPVLYATLVVIAFPVLTMFNYSPLSLAFGLGALLFLLRTLERGAVVDALLLGLLIGASALTKQNFGGLVLIACTIGLLLERRRSALRDRSVLIALLPVVIAGGAMAMLAVVHFAWIGTLGDLWHSTVLALGGSQVQDFNNPIPPILGRLPVDDSRFVFLYSPPTLFNALLHGDTFLGGPISPRVLAEAIRLSYGLPLLVLLGGVVLLALGARRDPAYAREVRYERVVIVFALVFAPGIFPSAIWSHLSFVIPPITLVAALLGDRLESALAARSRRGATALRSGLAAIVVLAIVSWLRITADVRAWYPVPMQLERASLMGSRAQVDLLRATMAFVERCSDDGDDWLFVAPDIPLVYFLADRLNPSPYDLMIPGNVDGALIADRLEETRVRCAVYNPRMYPEFPPFEQLFPELARHLARRYEPTTRLTGEGTEWIGLVRRDETTE